jgi:hypothetical protein
MYLQFEIIIFLVSELVIISYIKIIAVFFVAGFSSKRDQGLSLAGTVPCAVTVPINVQCDEQSSPQRRMLE